MRCTTAAFTVMMAVLAGADCRRSPARDLDELGAQIGSRPFAGWLSTMIEHRPIDRRRGGARPMLSTAAAEIYGRLGTIPSDERTPGVLLNAAGAELLVGRSELSAALVSEALAISPTSWEAWNDQAVIHLTRVADAGDDAVLHLARAVDAAMRATVLDPNQPQGWFNLALALSSAQLRTQGRSAVERLRALRPPAAWLAEASASAAAPATSTWDAARAALLDVNVPADRALERALPFPGRVRDTLMLELFPRWARALLAGQRADAVALEQRISSIAGGLAARDGDNLHRDCAESLTSVAATRDLANAHLSYAEGRRLYEDNRREEAQPFYARARVLWRAHRSPCHSWADLDLAIGRFQASQARQAAAEYRRIADYAKPRRYHSLHARAAWLRGTVLVAAGDMERGHAEYEEALELYRRTDDTWNLLLAKNAAADGLRMLGAHSVGWRYLSPVVFGLEELGEVRRRYLVLYNAALYAADTGLPWAALAFQNAALDEAARRGVANTIVEAHIQRGWRHSSLGDVANAARDLDEAERRLPEIASSRSAEYLGAWLRAVRAELLAVREPSRALGLIDDPLIRLFERREAAGVPRLYRIRGRAWLASGDVAAAAASFSDGIQIVEQMYANVTASPFRASYLDVSWDLFEDLISLHAAATPPEAAFVLAERARARGVTDAAPPMSAADTVGRLSPDTALLYYISLHDRLLVWGLSGRAQSFRSVPIGRSELGHRVGAYRRLIEVGKAKRELAVAGASLFESLIDRRWLEQTRSDRLLIVADGALHALPFGALVDPSSQRYVVEERAISILNNAGLVNRPVPPPVRGRSMSLLAVGAATAPGRPALPEVDIEVAELARAYRPAEALSNVRATPAALSAKAAAVDVIHFAGHAQADLAFPWSSYLVLSPDAGHPSGRLHAREIETWRLPRAPLVVLAACETAVGAVFRGEGVVSLAQPFLRAGARAVVGSLWNVEDRSTRRLITTLHARVAAGRSAAEALHDAQLTMLRSADPTDQLPRNWSGFVVIGR